MTIHLDLTPDRLMPCPFCGSADVSAVPVTPRSKIREYAVYCEDCRAYGPVGIGKTRATRLYNGRAAIQIIDQGAN